MNKQSLLALIILTLIGVGGYYYSIQNDGVNRSSLIGELLLAEVIPHANSIDKIVISGAGNHTVVTLNKQGSAWHIDERDNYIADISQIRRLVISLLEARIVEEKTSNVELYSRLGVEDISYDDAQGAQVTLYYGQASAALIVGKPGPQLNKNRYVRKPHENPSWLVDRKIDIKHDLTYWLDKDLFSVEPNQIAKVTIIAGDSSPLIIEHRHDENDSADSSHFKVTNLTDPNAYVVDAELQQVTNALSSFQLLDVAKHDRVASHPVSLNIEYQLNDGTVIAMQAYDVEGERYVSIDMDGPADFVANIQPRTKARVFKLPNVTYEAMFKREEDVLAITEDMLN
jgi:hypothetical protein